MRAVRWLLGAMWGLIEHVGYATGMRKRDREERDW